VDPAAVGLRFEALVQITLDRGDANTVASFEAAVSELPQVRQVERLFGDPDYLLRVVARDLDQFAALRDRELATLPTYNASRRPAWFHRPLDSVHAIRAWHSPR
jgi:DNA-binding Lrp family transcriptional regulator